MRTTHSLSMLRVGQLWVVLCLISSQLSAQVSPGPTRTDHGFRLNEIRPFQVAPNAQQPPYEWSATYLQNAFNRPNQQTYVLDSSICRTGIAGGTQFEDAFKVFNTYDSDLLLLEQRFAQRQAGGDYQNFSRKLYTYDSDGRQTNYLYQTWDGNAWQDDYEEASIYNSDGQPTQYQQREKDSNGQWLNLVRENRIYDSMQLVEIMTEYDLNGNWEPANRKLISYTELGFYDTIIELASEVGTWDTVGREIATYSNFGFDWDTYVIENYNFPGFEGVLRESYQYNMEGNLSEIIRQAYDPINMIWENEFREQFQYTNRSIWTGWARENWNNGAWEFADRQMYQSGANGRFDIAETYDVGTSSWSQTFRAAAAYDANQNPVRQMSKQAYDTGSGSWLNQNDTRECEHFWSQRSATRLENELPMMSCLLPNPYRAYAPMQCEGMEAGKRYQLQLIDLQGRTVYQKRIEGGTQFEIDRSLSTGLYQVQITEGAQVRYTQKLLIQP